MAPASSATENQWLGKWMHSIALGQAAMSPGDWRPFNVWAFEPFIGDAWVAKWLEVICRVEEDEPDLKTLADLVAPSLWRKELRFLSYNAKIWGYDRQTRMNLAHFFKRMLDCVYQDDPFGLESNTPKSYPPCRAIHQAEWQKADGQTIRQIGRIASSGPSLAWGLFTDFYYSNAYDMMGLFPTARFGQDATVMVKQFGPFRCPELWPESRKYQYNQILVGAAYKNLSGRFDIINHFITQDNLAEKTTHFTVLADGKPVTETAELELIQQTLARHAAEQFPRLNDLPDEKVKPKGAAIKFHQFKTVFEDLKMPWKPPKTVLERMKGRSYPTVRLPSSPSFETRVHQWKQLTDPRIEFTPAQQRYWNRWTQQLEKA